jgi:hypothetical protein
MGHEVHKGDIMSLNKLVYTVLGAMTLCLGLTVNAEEPAEEPQVGQLSQGDAVSINPADKEVVNEFRINGQLYMICINPKKGSNYCLVDADGDGNLETRKNDLTPDFLIPSWVLMRW